MFHGGVFFFLLIRLSGSIRNSSFFAETLGSDACVCARVGYISDSACDMIHISLQNFACFLCSLRSFQKRRIATSVVTAFGTLRFTETQGLPNREQKCPNHIVCAVRAVLKRVSEKGRKILAAGGLVPLPKSVMWWLEECGGDDQGI